MDVLTQYMMMLSLCHSRKNYFVRNIIIHIAMILFAMAAAVSYHAIVVQATSVTDGSSLSSLSVAPPKFRLGIRDSFMIAHSFHHHPSFGPAGGLHGATFTCDVDFTAPELHPELNWVMDIGEASSILSLVLSRYNYKNLDDIFGSDIMTTTEFLCRQIHSDLCQLLKERQIKFCSNAEICVKLWESHKAWASYTAPIV